MSADSIEKREPPTHIEQYGSEDAEKNPVVVPSKNIDEGFDPDEIKRITKKIDWRLIPVMSMCYAISLIDRTNLAIARAANNVYMDREIGTNLGDRYSIITLVFFIPYIVFELPSQLGLRRFGARIWLGSAVLLWGIVMLVMGFAPNWSTLAALRALLGMFESALFPGAAYLISCWYPRKDMAQRNVTFYITSAVAGSFAKPLGYAFSLLHGKGGRSGWRYLFIFYGALTIVIAIIAYIFIIDFPDRAPFLNAEERHIVTTRIERDRADSQHDPVTWKKIGKYASMLQPWLFAFMFMSTTTATYSLAYFLPTIIQSMGFSNVESMLLGTPAYFWALIPALTCGRIADRIRGTRAAVVVFNAICIIVGTCMYGLLPAKQKAARFAGIFFAVSGGNSNVPLIISWQHTAIRAQSKRAYCSAVTVAFGGIGGILGSTLFMEKEKKKGYPTGIYSTLGLNAAAVFVAIGLNLFYRRQNRRAERGEVVLEDHEDFRYQH